jgi:hypothetical protein
MSRARDILARAGGSLAVAVPRLRRVGAPPRGIAWLYIDQVTGHATVAKEDGTRADLESAAGGGSGDVTGPSSSVDSEVALFSGTTGKVIKRAAATGIAKLASGVLSAVTTWAGAGLTGTASHVATFDGSGNPSSKAVGTSAGTIAAGDDSRFIPPATATDKLLARTSSGAGAWEEATFTDAGQEAAALAAPSRVLAQGVGYLPSGALGWVARHDAIRRRFGYYADSASRTWGTDVTGSGGSFNVADATGYYNELTTAASVSAVAFVRDNTSQQVYQPRHGVELCWVVSPQEITTVLHWIASVSTTFPTPAGSTLPGHGVGFRFATDSSDANWIFCTRDGTTQNTTDTTIPVVAGNVYVLLASTMDAGVTWRWRVYDLTAGTTATGTTTTNVPGASTGLGWNCRVEARAAAARKLRVYGVSGELGARA